MGVPTIYTELNFSLASVVGAMDKHFVNCAGYEGMLLEPESHSTVDPQVIRSLPPTLCCSTHFCSLAVHADAANNLCLGR